MQAGGSNAATFMDSLQEKERTALLEAGRRRRWQRGDVLVRAGEAPDSAIVLLSGAVKVHRAAMDGAEVVLALMGPGDLLGEVVLLPGSVRLASATALEEVEGVVVPASFLRGFLAGHPRSTLAVLGIVLARLHEVDSRMLEFATSGSLARVTTRLIELAARFGVHAVDGAIDIRIPITQEDLASWSGASRESTGRALHTLRGLGLLETRRLRLVVRDLEGLRRHASRL